MIIAIKGNITTDILMLWYFLTRKSHQGKFIFTANNRTIINDTNERNHY